MVKNGANIIFNGGEDNRDVLLTLPKISNVQSGSEVTSFMDSDDKVIIKQLNFTDMQKNQDALYIITSTQSVVPEVKHFIDRAYYSNTYNTCGNGCYAHSLDIWKSP